MAGIADLMSRTGPVQQNSAITATPSPQASGLGAKGGALRSPTATPQGLVGGKGGAQGVGSGIPNLGLSNAFGGPSPYSPGAVGLPQPTMSPDMQDLIQRKQGYSNATPDAVYRPAVEPQVNNQWMGAINPVANQGPTERNQDRTVYAGGTPGFYDNQPLQYMGQRAYTAQPMQPPQPFNPGIGYRNGTPTEQFMINNASRIGNGIGTGLGLATGIPGLGLLGKHMAGPAVNSYFSANPNLALSNPASQQPRSPLQGFYNQVSASNPSGWGQGQSPIPARTQRNVTSAPQMGGMTYGSQGMGTGTWLTGPGTSALSTYNRGNAMRSTKKAKDWAELE